MAEVLRPDLCVIGAGAAGLPLAAAATQLGASVVVVERGAMGGARLNTGCIPTLALSVAARRAFARGSIPDFASVKAGIGEVVARLALNDSAPRYEGMGATVIRAPAVFVGPDMVEAGGRSIRARRFVIATGAEPAVPSVPGLDGIPFLTHKTVWDLDERPDHLVVLGAGPVGVELAQAFCRLGSRVTLIEAARLLPREDDDLAAVLRTALRRDGVVLHEGHTLRAVAPGLRLELDDGAVVIASHLLIATGRQPCVDGLGLNAAGIRHDAHGIWTDAGLRTTNRRVYAIGDVAGGPQLAHAAAQQAMLVLRSALFRLPVRKSKRLPPIVISTDPELAQVGLTEAAARERHGQIEVLRWAMADVDRAVVEDAPDGLAKIIVDRRGRILGAGIAGRHAGELIQPWVLAMENGLSARTLAQSAVPHPAWSELTRKTAVSWLTPRLFGNRVKALIRLLARLPN